jgi:hypothetical protein
MVVYTVRMLSQLPTHTINLTQSVLTIYLFVMVNFGMYAFMLEQWNYGLIANLYLHTAFSYNHKKQGYERQIFLELLDCLALINARRWYDERHAIEEKSGKLEQKPAPNELAINQQTLLNDLTH